MLPPPSSEGLFAVFSFWFGSKWKAEKLRFVSLPAPQNHKLKRITILQWLLTTKNAYILIFLLLFRASPWMMAWMMKITELCDDPNVSCTPNEVDSNSWVRHSRAYSPPGHTAFNNIIHHTTTKSYTANAGSTTIVNTNTNIYIWTTATTNTISTTDNNDNKNKNENKNKNRNKN